MNKQAVYDFLTERGVDFEPIEHGAVYTMDELVDVELPHKEADAKNLFIRDDKKNNYYLISTRGNKRLDIKAFRHLLETRPLNFCKEDELKEKLDIYPGAVSPFGLMNNVDCDVIFCVDEDFFCDDGLIGCHPNDNTATVFLKIADLVTLIEEHGNKVLKVTIPQKEQ